MKYIFLVITGLIFHTNLQAQERMKAKDREGLPVGADVTSFSATGQDGKTFELSQQLEEGPVVLVFYRGFWCPHCNKHLKVLQDSLSMIEDMGAKVVAVSPEKPEFLDKMANKSGAQFTLLYDEDYKIEEAFDLTFTPSKAMAMAYNVFMGAKMKESHSDDSQKLPIPATYIIDQNSKVIWRQFDPNYKKRSSVKAILGQLEKLKK